MGTRRNVVLVSIDSLRADHCGHLDGEYDITPTLDDLAAEGVAFENAIAPGPQTFSSMPVAFTGHHRPPESFDASADESGWERRLAAIRGHLERHSTLPERLAELGYATAGVSPNPWASSASGFDRGFDHFVDRSGTDSDGWLDRLVGAVPGVDADSRRAELAVNMLTGSSFFNRWERLYDDLTALRARLPEPYFLWVFVLDTHYPFVTGRAHREEQSWPGMYRSTYRSEAAMRGNAGTMPAEVRESTRRSYRDTVRAVDAFLARLRADFAPDDPAVVVHSDHGESFGEHGNYGHHHRQVYEENVHVPYVVHNAGRRETVEEPTSLASIPDLVLELATTGTVDPRTVTAQSVVAASVAGENHAVRGRRYKYVRHGDEESLFDLEADPDELRDIADERPERRREFRARLGTHRAHVSEVAHLHRATERVSARSDI